MSGPVHNLASVLKHTTLRQCASCHSHEYILPFPITSEIESFLKPFGSLKYPLDKIKIIKIDNNYVHLNSRIGSSNLRVKFKKDPSQRSLFEVQLAAYIEKEMQISVETTELLK